MCSPILKFFGKESDEGGEGLQGIPGKYFSWLRSRRRRQNKLNMSEEINEEKLLKIKEEKAKEIFKALEGLSFEVANDILDEVKWEAKKRAIIATIIS